jgi:lysylphosphatidylglycerol synthetase-like protein (DUF2156 family)
MNRKLHPSRRLFLILLAGLSALVALNFTLRLMHMLETRGRLGIFEFYESDITGAILWGVVTLLWVYLAIGLIRRDPNGWWFLVVLSILTIVLGLVSYFGESNWRAMVPVLLANGLILVICLLPGTRGEQNAPHVAGDPDEILPS